MKPTHFRNALLDRGRGEPSQRPLKNSLPDPRLEPDAENAQRGQRGGNRDHRGSYTAAAIPPLTAFDRAFASISSQCTTSLFEFTRR